MQVAGATLTAHSVDILSIEWVREETSHFFNLYFAELRWRNEISLSLESQDDNSAKLYLIIGITHSWHVKTQSVGNI